MSFYKENMLILLLFGIIFGIIVFFYSNSTHEDVYTMIYVSPIIVCIVMSVHISRRSKKSPIFSLGFLFLGISMMFLLTAELTWVVMPYFDLPQYESYPDIFYASSLIVNLFFPLFILRHYKTYLGIVHYLVILLIIAIGVLSYVLLSNMDSLSFSFGLIFVFLSSGMVGISLVTMLTLHNTKIFHVWCIIVFSFLISMIADISYYSSENTTDWFAGDWVNFVWFASYLIMILALSEQRHAFTKKEMTDNYG